MTVTKNDINGIVASDYGAEKQGLIFTGTCADDSAVVADLFKWRTDSPLLLVCPTAGFSHGSIGKDPNMVICENLGDTLSWRMEDAWVYTSARIHPLPSLGISLHRGRNH